MFCLAAFLPVRGHGTDTSRRLRIRNGCDVEPMWIANDYHGSDSDRLDERIASGGFVDLETTPGNPTMRYWPKMWCDADGKNCALGSSGDRGRSCIRDGGDDSLCAPTVDTQFEATFGNGQLTCDPARGQVGGCDHLDVSLVNGFTLPFSIQALGSCFEDDLQVADSKSIDCSRISTDSCPTAERLGNTTVDLRAKNPFTQQVVGCYSPCSKLTDDRWNNTQAHGRQARDSDAAPYCCPTPPETPVSCRAGPVASSAYVAAVHQICPGVYGYAYDDNLGLVRCTSQTHYEVTFYCPSPMPSPPVAKEAEPHKELSGDAIVGSSSVSEATGASSTNTDGIAQAGDGPCSRVCHTPEGEASCAYRMQWAALTRYRDQAQSCDLSNVLVLLDCARVCDGCDVEHSGCPQAIATGETSEIGSPAWVKKTHIKTRRPQADQNDVKQRVTDSEFHTSQGSPSEPEQPGDSQSSTQTLRGRRRLKTLPNIIAGLSVAIIVSACIMSYATKALGWSLPAPRAAAAMAEQGAKRAAASREVPDSPNGYGNTYKYEGVSTEQDGGGLVDTRGFKETPETSRTARSSPTSTLATGKAWF